MLYCDSYLIDGRALAIKSVFVGEYRSKIYSKYQTYYSKLTPKELLEKACLNHMSSMDGRMKAAKGLLNITMKPPFIIIPNECGVFPTESPDNLDCVYIFNHLFTLEEVTKGETIITFMNGTKVQVKASKNTIIKQNLRLGTLISTSHMLLREWKHLESKMYVR